jgi:glycosyltransferase involved in cell wall biosynthesis
MEESRAAMVHAPGCRDQAVCPCSETVAQVSARPEVSVVIPVYNGSNYLAEAIESCLRQTYKPPIEILVVNDGSTDNGETRQVALGFGDRVRYFEKPNGGVASALNKGIEEMLGQYFSWLSHDDLYTEHKLEMQVGFLESLESAPAVVYGDVEYVDERSNTIGALRYDHSSPANFPYHLIHDGIHGCSLLIPRRCFEVAGVFDESLLTTQDHDLWFRMAKHFPFHHLPEIAVRSRVHDLQGTVTFGHKHTCEREKLYKFMLRTVREEKTTADWTLPEAVALSNIALALLKRGCTRSSATAMRYAMRRFVAFGVVRQNGVFLRNALSYCRLRLRSFRRAIFRRLKRFPS